MEHEHGDSCRNCDGCGECLFIAGFKQDSYSASLNYPMYFCLKCGKNNFWD